VLLFHILDVNVNYTQFYDFLLHIRRIFFVILFLYIERKRFFEDKQLVEVCLHVFYFFPINSLNRCGRFGKTKGGSKTSVKVIIRVTSLCGRLFTHVDLLFPSG